METKSEIGKKMEITPLKEYYIGLNQEQRKMFIKAVQTKTQLSHNAVYNWIKGKTKIKYGNACIVSSITGIPVSQLFEHFRYLDSDGNSSQS